MYAIKKFDEGEAEYSVLLRRKLEEAEAMLLKLNPSRERSLALTKLDEALLWANAAIAAAGVSTDRESSAASEAAEQSWAMMSAPVMKKEIAIDIPKEIRLGEPICDISTMICNSMNNKTQAIGSKRWWAALPGNENRGEIKMEQRDFMTRAKQLVVDYFNSHVDVTDGKKLTMEDVFIVWFSKTLQNWKALVSTTVSDGMYYEITHNGDKKETYLDVYKKWENQCIADGDTAR